MEQNEFKYYIMLLMDTIDKYYKVCELFNDDVYKVVQAIKDEGFKSKPSRIYNDVCDRCDSR